MTLEEKHAAWDSKRREIDEIGDKLGRGIDEGVKETVVALNMLGFNTTGSCEGHFDRLYLTPYIDFAAPDRPETTFIGETEVFQRVADKYHIPLEEFRRGQDQEGWWEAFSEAGKNGLTPEFARFTEETQNMEERFAPLLEEFNLGRSVPAWIQLNLYEGGYYHRIASGGSNGYGLLSEQFEQTLPIRDRATLLVQRQNEMTAFTGFLKNKYFAANAPRAAGTIGLSTP